MTLTSQPIRWPHYSYITFIRSFHKYSSTYYLIDICLGPEGIPVNKTKFEKTQNTQIPILRELLS